MAEIQKDEHLLKYSDQIDLGLSEEVVTNLELEVAPDITQTALDGRVVDSEGTPIEGATVKLFDEDFNPIVHTVTDEYGMYLFSTVTPGTYLIYAVKENYSLSTKATVTIVDENVSQPNIVLTKLTDVDTSLYYGIVKDKEGIAVASMIINLLVDDVIKYTTISADDGEFIIYGIEAGEYKVEAYNNTYKLSGIYTITFDTGVSLNSDLEVTKYASVLQGTINGVVVDSDTKTPIEGAFVAVYKVEDGKEEIISATLTDEDGRYFFGDLPEGQYIVKAKSIKTTV